ncbi:MAG TPA: DUF6325 family protein [Thermomicrobiales bacterium]
MSLGPIEFLALKFPGNQFRGEIVPALADLVEDETIRIIDLLFVQKAGDGAVRVVELADLGEDEYRAYEEVVSDVSGLLSHDDAREIAKQLEPNSSAALLLFENVWATQFADAVANAKGEVLVNERIPRAMIEEMLASDPVA